MNAIVDHDPLRADLIDGGHDTSYRAMSFIGRCGGPPIRAATADFAGLAAQRAEMIAWLDAQPARPALADEYGHFCRHWSPVFKD